MQPKKAFAKAFARWDPHRNGLSRLQRPLLLLPATSLSPPAAGKRGAGARRPCLVLVWLGSILTGNFVFPIRALYLLRGGDDPARAVTGVTELLDPITGRRRDLDWRRGFTRWDLHRNGLSRLQWPPLLPPTTSLPTSATGNSDAGARLPCLLLISLSSILTGNFAIPSRALCLLREGDDPAQAAAGVPELLDRITRKRDLDRSRRPVTNRASRRTSEPECSSRGPTRDSRSS